MLLHFLLYLWASPFWFSLNSALTRVFLCSLGVPRLFIYPISSSIHFPPPIFNFSHSSNGFRLLSRSPKISSILFFCVLLPHTGSSIPPSHFCVSPLVGAGCVRRPSSISLTCRSTPSRTQRPNLTSVLTAPSHSPTPATWPSTSASIAGPSPTPAPTARNLSGSSVTYSSTHGTYWPLPVLPFTTSPKLHFCCLYLPSCTSPVEAFTPPFLFVQRKLVE